MPFDHDIFAKGYEDGLHGEQPTREDNDDYMSGHRVGSVDRMEQMIALREANKPELRAVS